MFRLISFICLLSCVFAAPGYLGGLGLGGYGGLAAAPALIHAPAIAVAHPVAGATSYVRFTKITPPEPAIAVAHAPIAVAAQPIIQKTILAPQSYGLTGLSGIGLHGGYGLGGIGLHGGYGLGGLGLLGHGGYHI
ncbi:cuticle protein 63-like [Chrysoperla carnea]|uniref:cuticle protein 63-like n=1 Tax=Chrysoperla carnea TaxID=189513 RepID=UPI001D093279|nr:cuticle protein 63-like [Chrysoperla carnea]